MLIQCGLNGDLNGIWQDLIGLTGNIYIYYIYIIIFIYNWDLTGFNPNDESILVLRYNLPATVV